MAIVRTSSVFSSPRSCVEHQRLPTTWWNRVDATHTPHKQTALKLKAQTNKMKLQTFAAATSLLFLASNVDTTLGATSPTRIVDSHHHFFDFPEYNYSYLPEDYTADVVDPLAESNITLSGSVHVEFVCACLNFACVNNVQALSTS